MAQSNSLNINLSLFDLNSSFDESNINSTLAQTDFDVYTNATHFELNEKFVSDRVYLNTSKKRELLTYSSLLFVNSNSFEEEIYSLESFLENTKEISVITNNTSNDFINIENRDFALYTNVKNNFSNNYLDKSVYTIRRAGDDDNSTFNI